MDLYDAYNRLNSLNEGYKLTKAQITEVMDKNGYDVEDYDVIKFIESAAEKLEIDEDNDIIKTANQWFKDIQEESPEKLDALPKKEKNTKNESIDDEFDDSYLNFKGATK